MKQTNEYIELIKAHSDELKSQFGVRTLRLFGSVSRGEQNEQSDVDVCVEMDPKLYLVVRLQRYLEELLMCSVDVIRLHKHMNPYLLRDINRDGIYVIGEASGSWGQALDPLTFKTSADRAQSVIYLLRFLFP